MCPPLLGGQGATCGTAFVPPQRTEMSLKKILLLHRAWRLWRMLRQDMLNMTTSICVWLPWLLPRESLDNHGSIACWHQCAILIYKLPITGMGKKGQMWHRGNAAPSATSEDEPWWAQQQTLPLYESHALPFPLCSFCCSQEGPSYFALILAAWSTLWSCCPLSGTPAQGLCSSFWPSWSGRGHPCLSPTCYLPSTLK